MKKSLTKKGCKVVLITKTIEVDGKMIRKMTNSDHDRVKEIYKQGIECGTATFNAVCPSFEEWDASHIAECRYVYEEDNTIVGWVALSKVSDRYAYRGVAEVSIYIDEQYHGQGIGTKLLEYECMESEKAGFWSLYAAIFSTNKASIAIHKKCGFREIGYREKIAKDRFGKWQDTVLMEKRSSVII
ncbi:MAG: GNAT family N-acetyltransferase [Clostridia bacterium]